MCVLLSTQQDEIRLEAFHEQIHSSEFRNISPPLALVSKIPELSLARPGRALAQ